MKIREVAALFLSLIKKSKSIECADKLCYYTRWYIGSTDELRNISLNLAGGKEEYMAALTSFAETPEQLNEYLKRMSRHYV